MAAVAATCLVSIFAAEGLLVAALLVQLARIVTGRARFLRLPVDAPILAFSVWTLLSASFSRDPVESFEDAKKLVLFLLFYLAADVMTEERPRERVLDAALLGGFALSTGAAAAVLLPRLQYHQQPAAQLSRPLHDGLRALDGHLDPGHGAAHASVDAWRCRRARTSWRLRGWSRRS